MPYVIRVREERTLAMPKVIRVIRITRVREQRTPAMP
jgi:hypothetical protein